MRQKQEQENARNFLVLGGFVLWLEEANLRQRIQQLTGNGGFSNVAICYDTNNRKRLCVQIDESARVPSKGY